MKYSLNSFYEQLTRETHLLIAGTTGSGKSTLLNDIIYSIRLAEGNKAVILVDPKKVEFIRWRDTDFVTAHATTPEDIEWVLQMVEKKMDQRFSKMMDLGIQMTNEIPIYVIVDELADLMQFNNSKELKRIIGRISRLGRASQIHLILATQNPSRSKNGGLPPEICQNITSVIALRCRSAIESRQVLGKTGAEKLPKFGKCIYSGDSGEYVAKLEPTDKEKLNSLIEECRRK